MKLKLLAIACLLCMAPNVYFPTVARPCPAPRVNYISTLLFSNHAPTDNTATVFFGTVADVYFVDAVDIDGNYEIHGPWGPGSPIFFSNFDSSDPNYDGIQIFFHPDCASYEKPLQVRFDIYFVGGCQASATAEYIPHDYWEICD